MADANGAVTLTAASFAGYALEAADGDARAAQDIMPTDPASFWSRAHDALDMVATEERKPVGVVSAILDATGTDR
jgi:hypothetical protein